MPIVTSFRFCGLSMPEFLRHWSGGPRSPPRRTSPASHQQQPRPHRSRSRSSERPREFQREERRPSPSHAQGRSPADVYPHQQHRLPHFGGAGHDYERPRGRPFNNQPSSYQQLQPRVNEDAGRWRQNGPYDAPHPHHQPPQQQPYRHHEAPPSSTLMLRGLAPAVHDAMVVLYP